MQRWSQGPPSAPPLSLRSSTRVSLIPGSVEVRTLREAQIAKSETYYDANNGRDWRSVHDQGLWNLRWKARLRRVRQPNQDLARLFTGPGASYIEDAAAGSNADVSRIVDSLVAASPADLAAWAAQNIGPLDSTQSTGGMVH